MALFEVCILEKPTKLEADNGRLERLVLGPLVIIARDSQSAAYEAVMRPPQPITVDTSRMEVVVRPFK